VWLVFGIYTQGTNRNVRHVLTDKRDEMYSGMFIWTENGPEAHADLRCGHIDVQTQIHEYRSEKKNDLFNLTYGSPDVALSTLSTGGQ
jgi:hypothetical protein